MTQKETLGLDESVFRRCRVRVDASAGVRFLNMPVSLSTAPQSLEPRLL
jgi:hypothetical protein